MEGEETGEGVKERVKGGEDEEVCDIFTDEKSEK